MTMIEKVEFSRPIGLEKIKTTGMELEISATPDECKALARRFDLVGINRLDARLDLRRHEGAGGAEYVVAGDFSADVVQPCAITLEPIETCVASKLAVRYMSPQAYEEFEERHDQDTPLDLEEEDIEVLPDGVLDLGELVAQYLAISLESYPRKQGVDLSAFGILTEEDHGAQPKEGKVNPFSILKKLYD